MNKTFGCVLAVKFPIDRTWAEFDFFLSLRLEIPDAIQYKT